MAYVTGKSGSFVVEGKPFSGRITWSETYDIVTNTSIVSIDNIEVKSSNWYGVGYYPSGSISIDGVKVGSASSGSGTHYVYISKQNTYYEIVESGDKPFTPWVSSPIAHNTDGKKSVIVSVSIGLYTKNGNYSSGSKFTGDVKIELTDIPRAATITAAPNFTDEANPTITYNNPAGTAIDKLEACISLTSARADIAYREISKTGTSYTFNLTEAEREVLRLATLEGSNSRTVYFILQTTIGGTTYRSPLAKTFTVINAEPQLSALVMDINEKTVALTGDSLTTIIKGYSNAAYELSATALKGASITGYKASNGSAQFTTDSGIFAATQSADFTFSATDNRGQTATASRKLILIDYFKPSCNAEATIELDGETTARVDITITGSFFNGSFGAVKNSLEILIKHSATDRWVSLTNELYFEPTIKGNTYTIDFGVSNLDYTQPFTYQCKVIDKLAEATSAEDTKTIYPIFDWSNEEFNFNVPISMNNNQTLRATDTGRVVLSANEGDIYLRPNGSTTDAGQFRITTTGALYADGVRVPTLDLIYPVGSIYMSVNSTNPANLFGGTWERIQDRFLLAAGSTYGAGNTGGSATHSHTLSDAAIALINHHDGKFWFAEKEGVSYVATGSGSASGAVVNVNQTAAIPLRGGTDSGSTLPPYLAVYMWKRTG